MRETPEEATVIELSELKESYTIQSGGDYILEGEFARTLYIDAEDQIVHLFMNNVQINSNTGSAICVNSAGKLIITLMNETQNTFIDAHVRTENIKEEATIISNTDITINGNGELFVYGYYEDAIRTKDVLKIIGGNIVIQSKGDGLRGSDGILLCPSNLKVESEETGILTNNAGKNGKGTVEITGGEISIVGGEYAILAQQNLVVRNCRLTGKGVKGRFYVEGKEYIDKECLTDE